MSGLAHVFEAAGIPTTLVSLIREHTAVMRPPRALWVPFELGRPFGPPDDADLQTRVLSHALRLLEAPTGPVLEDFPDSDPRQAGADTAWSCPVQFGAPPASAGDLRRAVAQEMALLRPWYARALAQRGRTTVGISGLAIDELAAFLHRPLDDEETDDGSGHCTADGVRLAAEDLKAYYTEAGMAQPGAHSSAEVLRWFWRETSAGHLLRALQAQFTDSEDADLRLLAALLLVPRAHA